MTTAEKNLPYFLFGFFHPNKSVSDLQPLVVNLIISYSFLNTFCMRYSWLIVIFIVRLLSAIMKLCQNILKFIFVENFEGDISGNHSNVDVSIFLSIFFSLQISAIYISLQSIFYTDSTLPKKYILNMSIS